MLRRDSLDGSLDSLLQVDEYLTFLHQNRERLSDEEWGVTVIRTGAYVGEVIRQSCPNGAFNWIDYNDYIALHSELRSLIPDRTAATCAFLVHRSGAMSMPLNKVARFIEDGPADSVHFFAMCDIKREKSDASNP